MDLQISTKHWEAPSEHAWAALHPWTQTPRSLRFRPLLRSFFHNPREAQAGISDDHHRLPIILTIMRTLYTVRELEGNPASDFFQGGPSHAEDRALLLHILNHFLVSPRSPQALSTSTSLVDVVHRLQTVHMAHIVSGGAFTDWLYPLLRGGAEFESAQERMRKWAAEDSSRIRDQAFHCGQILGLVREYPFNIPQEAFNVYHAGTLLWCLSALLAQHPARSTGLEFPSCRLDFLGDYESQPLVNIREWIQRGQSRNLSLHGVPDLLTDDGRDQLLHQTAEMLRGMRVWGIAQNFLRVVLKLARKESQDHIRSVRQSWEVLSQQK